MPKKHNDLFEQITNFDALEKAAQSAAKGRRSKPNVSVFMANREHEVIKLEEELRNNTYTPGPYKAFCIKDPKPRTVSAAPFRDRVVHHALCSVVEPIFDRSFIYDTYANRTGKGAHKAVSRFRHFMARNAFVLRCDIHRYFPSIDHEILKNDLRRRIICKQTLCLLDKIIDKSNKQEAVELYFPGDDLFEPFARRRGLPLGNLTSQFFANVYLNPLDHYVKEVLKVKGYVRYVDDFAIFGQSEGELKSIKTRVENFLQGRRLIFHPQKTVIQACSIDQLFLGYVLKVDGKTHINPENVDRFHSKIRSFRFEFRQGLIEFEAVARSVRGWEGHAKFAHSLNLRHKIFKGGVFDPFLKC